MCTYAHHGACMEFRGVELAGVGSLYPPCGSQGDRTQVIRLSSRHLYPSSHPAGPRHLFNSDSLEVYNDSSDPVSPSPPLDGEKTNAEQFTNLLGSHKKVTVELGFKKVF